MTNPQNKKSILILWGLSIAGFWSLLPYIQYLGILPPAASFATVALLGTIQVALFFGLLCWLSYKLLPKTDLRPFSLQNLSPALISGVLLGFALFFADKTVFKTSLFSSTHPPFWIGALASIYGGINEEVMLRLFLFTLCYFFFGKCIRNRTTSLWTANIFVALLFGIGHLPAAFSLTTPSALEIFRILFLNGIAGIVFGWLYYSRGIWAAVSAHIATDLMVHAFLIGL